MSHSVYTALEDERVKSKGESGQMVRKLLLVFALTVVLLSSAGTSSGLAKKAPRSYNRKVFVR